ncbi:ClpX C4-type zinc finger protein [Citrobacter freundii]|uniref:ClpX C4-type zinc finger protein n=1 Tax=Citrobacter freundii TaxID=546 RepID=UPI0028F87B1B|nr:ClpX C4-type zinc finger protein [Citrobacter freundii]MDT9778497.1 ClpX C4-type zinc finger protein [Citrobacter freundii]
MELIKCAFCGKTQDEVPLIIHDAVRNAAICSGCTSTCMKIVNKKLVVPVMADEMQKKELGRTNEFLVNGAPLALLNTKTAVAADYLLFLEGVIKALLGDREGIEREANKSGRTINGHGFSFIGSVDIPQVPDEQINSDL